MLIRPSRLIACFVCVTWISSSAYAGPPTVAVPPLGESTAHQRASQAVAQALKSTGKISVVDTQAVLRYLQGQKKPGSSSKPGNEEASKALSRGEGAYKQLRMKEALRELTTAKLLYREALLDEDSFQALRAAQFHLAMAYLASKDEGRAREELREVVLLDPERNSRELSTKLYPPSIRKMYKEMTTELAKKDQGELVIDTSPPGALVQVDGKSYGSSPIKVKKLPAGQHFIRVQKEGTDGFFGPKFMVAGENRMELELRPAVPTDVYRNFGTVGVSSEIEPRRAAFLEDMGLALNSDIIVFLSPDVAKVKGQLYDQRSQEISNVEVDATPEGLAAKLLRSLDKDGYVIKIEKKPPPPAAGILGGPKLPKNLQPDAEGSFTQQAKAPDQPPMEGKRSFFLSPWFWGAVVAVVLIGAGAGVLLFTDIGKKKASTSTLTVAIP